MLPRHRKRLAFARGFALLATLGVGIILGPSEGLAQDTQTHYLKDKEFEIPYNSTADQNLKQLHLFVSTDRKAYERISSTALRKGAFPYTAKGDGEYSFVVQSEDASGIKNPREPVVGPPVLRVIVDSQKPHVEFQAVQPKGKRAAVEWQIEDANLDLRTLHMEFKGPGESAWTPLKFDLLKAAQFGWNPVGNGPFEVRLSVKDFAGNEATATTQVTPTAGAAPIPGSASTDGAQVIHVKHKKFRLTYKIEMEGPSSVKEVQVWMTRDKLQWSKYVTAPASGPYEITVPTTGRYGFTLRPMSGVGRGPTPPRGGDAPHIWVEVDDTAPVVTLNSVRVGEGADSGKVVVNYIATDKFLKEQPVTISYREKADEPWKILQEHLENTGRASVTPPERLFKFFVKVEAVDKAGNKGSAQSKDAVEVDLHIPKATNIGVEAVDPNAAGSP